MFNDKSHEAVKQVLNAWSNTTDALPPILNAIGDAEVVLIGEATHGTHEFYDFRAELTQHLITEKGFNAVAVEADWPDAYRVNAFVHGQSEDETALDALSDFQRFPLWMWRNTVVAEFVDWLYDFNLRAADKTRTGFYGLDLYSLRRSMEAVINYLQKIDPDAAERARFRYSCFDHYGNNPQFYGYSTSHKLDEDCEDDVVQQLLELHDKSTDYTQRDGRVNEDAYFYAEQNARLAKNAEAYYRAMYRGRATSWNLRDSHMMETLLQLRAHLKQKQGRAKIVVWAHNSHLGDARATQMSKRGEHNLGQLARQEFGEKCFNIGFSTFTGTVTAASDWEAEAERKHVRAGLPESYERLFHELDVPQFSLELKQLEPNALQEAYLQRAIGVIYRPETERESHYFYARLRDQFNMIIHMDETTALQPLDMTTVWQQGVKLPDTYPFGE